MRVLLHTVRDGGIALAGAGCWEVMGVVCDAARYCSRSYEGNKN